MTHIQGCNYVICSFRSSGPSGALNIFQFPRTQAIHPGQSEIQTVNREQISISPVRRTADARSWTWGQEKMHHWAIFIFVRQQSPTSKVSDMRLNERSMEKSGLAGKNSRTCPTQKTKTNKTKGGGAKGRKRRLGVMVMITKSRLNRCK